MDQADYFMLAFSCPVSDVLSMSYVFFWFRCRHRYPLIVEKTRFLVYHVRVEVCNQKQ